MSHLTHMSDEAVFARPSIVANGVIYAFGLVTLFYSLYALWDSGALEPWRISLVQIASVYCLFAHKSFFMCLIYLRDFPIEEPTATNHEYTPS